MQEKIVDIHIRVSENEKKKLQQKAKKSKLSLSNYLRKTGLKQKIYPMLLSILKCTKWAKYFCIKLYKNI